MGILLFFYGNHREEYVIRRNNSRQWEYMEMDGVKKYGGYCRIGGGGGGGTW